jgi:hypothetical protein
VATIPFKLLLKWENPLEMGTVSIFSVPNFSGDRSLRSLRGEFGGGAEERFQGSQGGAALRVEVLEDQVLGRYIQQKKGGNMSYLIIYIYIIHIYIYCNFQMDSWVKVFVGLQCG